MTRLQLKLLVQNLNALRHGEGDSVTLFCDNRDFNGQPNNAVECNGHWTGWRERRFTGSTLAEAVQAAVDAMFDHDNPPETMPFEVVGFQWEVTPEHINAGRGLKVGHRGGLNPGQPNAYSPRGLVQIWHLRNGQEVRARWKGRASRDEDLEARLACRNSR